MRQFVIAMLLLSVTGVVFYFLFAERDVQYFLAGIIFGLPLGALLVRVLVHKYLKPEYYERVSKNEAAN